MRIVLLGVVLCIVAFFVGVFAPRRSKRLEGWVKRIFKRGEGKAQKRAGKLGDATRVMLKWTRRATMKSGESGRTVNRKAGEAGTAVADKGARAARKAGEKLPG